MKKNLFIFILVVVVIALVVFIIFDKNNNFNKEEIATLVPVATTTEEVIGNAAIASGSIENFIGDITALPDSAEAPKPEIITEESQIPLGAIKLEISDKGFTPKSFKVLAGKPVTLALTATGVNTHVFIFPNDSLMGLTVLIRGGETKTINFVSPKAGTYLFRDDIPTYRENTGEMIVKDLVIN